MHIPYSYSFQATTYTLYNACSTNLLGKFANTDEIDYSQ